MYSNSTSTTRCLRDNRSKMPLINFGHHQCLDQIGFPTGYTKPACNPVEAQGDSGKEDCSIQEHQTTEHWINNRLPRVLLTFYYDLYVVYLDLAKAYGSVPHKLIEFALEYFYVPPKASWEDGKSGGWDSNRLLRISNLSFSLPSKSFLLEPWRWREDKDRHQGRDSHVWWVTWTM